MRRTTRAWPVCLHPATWSRADTCRVLATVWTFTSIIQTHRYTVELRLTYGLRDPDTGEPDPSAFVRLYRDAHQAEATHCYVGRRWQDVIGMYPPPAELIGHRMRMNTFLGKWLEYLAERGHGVATLQRYEDEPVQPAAAVV